MLLEGLAMESNKNTIQVKLPPIAGQGQEILISDKNSIVLIGANGSGKTRMSVWIEGHNSEIRVHRVSAQKSLDMPESTTPSDLKKTQNELLNGNSESDNKSYYRWAYKPATHLLRDFDALMKLLITENYKKCLILQEQVKSRVSICYEPTKLDLTIALWEKIIANKRLKINETYIAVSDVNAKYTSFNGSEMSDGEREIFYFIGTVLCMPKNSLIIIDEPENHLHKSILIRLWNEIESARSDCIFIYVTHSLDFAVSRNNSQIVWVKDMPEKDVWEYELLSEDDSRLDAVKLEILGNRQNVLLVEGTQQKSIDRRLYSAIFKDYNVIPVENCDRVIVYTKACKNLGKLHYCRVKGIVDRDRRSETDIKKLSQDNIFCPEVAEIENLFLLPEIIEVVAEKQDKLKCYDEILKSVQEKTFDFLNKNIDSQALLFVQQNVQNQINRFVGKREDDLEVYKKNIAEIQKIDIDGLHAEMKFNLQKIIDEKNFHEALKFINAKCLLSETKLSNNFGWTKPYYVDYVIGLLSGTDVSEKLCDIFRKYVNIEKNLEVSNNGTD